MLTPHRPEPVLHSLPPMLGNKNVESIPSCSKAPWGLFVLLQVDGIFTVIAISPGCSLRQFPNRYTFHAGQNLPDKEFRYLRTIIVIADVHWRFGDWREPLPLTFQHWSGVTPYTSPCGFAESCVFGKQSLEKLSLRPTLHSILQNSKGKNWWVTLDTSSVWCNLDGKIRATCAKAFRHFRHKRSTKRSRLASKPRYAPH